MRRFYVRGGFYMAAVVPHGRVRLKNNNFSVTADSEIDAAKVETNVAEKSE